MNIGKSMEGAENLLKMGEITARTTCWYKDSNREATSDRTRGGVQNLWRDIFGEMMRTGPRVQGVGMGLALTPPL